MLNWYQHLPQYFGPIAFEIGSFSVRWYSLNYIVAFSVVYVLLNWRIKNKELVLEKFNKEQLQIFLIDFMLVAMFASLLGGRLGYVLFYNLPYFLAHPKEILFPINGAGNFSGFFGMSYHGALIGIVLASWIYLKKKKIAFLKWADFIVPTIPSGYFFGRIGNFLNGELYGRATDSRFGMYFQRDVQSLRYPSQLIEAFLEGLLLFVLLWRMRNKSKNPGHTLSFYLMGYAIFRFGESFFGNLIRRLDISGTFSLWDNYYL